jgi:hypothetical protein
MSSQKVKVDRHDAGGVKTGIIGPRLNEEMDAWSVIVGSDDDVVVATAVVNPEDIMNE